MEETEEGIELREIGEEGRKRRSGRSAGEERLEAFLKEMRGGAEITVVSACCFCGERLSEDLVPLSVGRELSAEHRRKEHPEIIPRDTQDLREKEELKAEQRRKKKRQDRETWDAKLAARQAESTRAGPRRSRGKTSQSGSKPGRPNRQPELTEEMIREMRILYGQLGSNARVAERCYKEFGFSSPERLRVTLSRAKKESGIILGIPKNRRRLTKEMTEKAKRLYEEERMSIREISKCYHVSWGYSLRGLQRALREIFTDHGVDFGKEPRRTLKRPSRMTPRRIEVAWQLYSLGNYSLREIGEMAYKLWGYKRSSCKNSIGEALKMAGYKLRASRWENNGSRPISREEALELIKSVS